MYNIITLLLLSYSKFLSYIISMCNGLYNPFLFAEQIQVIALSV